MTNHTCEDQFGVIFAPLVEQEVGYKPGNPGIPVLNLHLALTMGLSTGKSVCSKKLARALN